MKLTHKIALISLLPLSFSCKDEKEVASINEPSMPYKELKELALEKGDTSAYHEMSVAFMDSPNDDSFLATSLTMADKHNFHEAYLDVYYCLTDYYHRKDFKDLDDLDEKTRKKAIKYLTLGAEKGDKECKKLLGNYYVQGKYVKKDVIKGNQLIAEGEKY
jgi:TPR repeat protein